MSRIESLIDELCPGGVKFISLAEVANVGTGSSNRNESNSQGTYPFYVRSKTVFFADDYEFDEEAIIIPGEGGIGEIFHYVNGKYALHQRAYRISIHESQLQTKFVLYYMQSNFKKFILTKAVSATVTSIRKPMILDFIVPLPPLKVQQEIVRILDAFTELEAELEAELDAREKQYEHYRNTLLSLPEQSEVRWVPMAEIADLNWGDTSKTKSSYVAEGYLAFSAAGGDGLLNSYDYDRPGIVLSAIGALAGKTWRARGKWSCIKNTIRIFSLDETVVLTDYLYWFSSTPNFWPRRGSAQPFISKGDADKVMVAVPEIEEQKRIVNILDAFEEIIRGIDSGLPAEIEARRKQYEYYRDKLLTFKELVA